MTAQISHAKMSYLLNLLKSGIKPVGRFDLQNKFASYYATVGGKLLNDA